MPTIPLFGTAMRGKSRFVTSQERINLFIEPTVDGDKYETAYYSRPGLTRLNAVTDPIPGIHAVNGPPLGAAVFIGTDSAGIEIGEFLWVARNGGWEVWSSPLLRQTWGGAIGETVPTTRFVSMAYAGTVANRGFAVDGIDAWYMVPSNVQTAIPASNTGGFPWLGATSVTTLAGRLIVNYPARPGQFCWSPLLISIGMVWSGLDFATAESSEDALVAVKAFRGELVLFGTKTIEFWAPSAQTVFAPIQGTTAPWGLIAQETIGVVGDHLFFLGKTENGKAQVCVLNGYKPQVVSTPDIDYLINIDYPLTSVHGAAFSVLGHEFYTLSLSDKTLVFDATTQSWAYWSTDGGRWAGKFVVEAFAKLMVGDYRDTREYELTPDVYNDDGGLHFIREITGRHLFQDMERITVNSIMLDVETGPGPPIYDALGVERAPQVMMQLSKDGGRTFGFELWESIGKLGEYRTLVWWKRLGRARDLVFRFRVADPVKVTLQGASARISGQGGDAA